MSITPLDRPHSSTDYTEVSDFPENDPQQLLPGQTLNDQIPCASHPGVRELKPLRDAAECEQGSKIADELRKIERKFNEFRECMVNQYTTLRQTLKTQPQNIQSADELTRVYENVSQAISFWKYLASLFYNTIKTMISNSPIPPDSQGSANQEFDRILRELNGWTWQLLGFQLDVFDMNSDEHKAVEPLNEEQSMAVARMITPKLDPTLRPKAVIAIYKQVHPTFAQNLMRKEQERMQAATHIQSSSSFLERIRRFFFRRSNPLEVSAQLTTTHAVTGRLITLPPLSPFLPSAQNPYNPLETFPLPE